MRRTTNSTDCRVHTVPFPRCVALLLALLLVPAGAAAAELQMQLALLPAAVHMPQRAPLLRVSLTWPTSCLPTVERVSMIEDRIDIVLRSSAVSCTAAPTLYDVIVDPARASASASLQSRVYGVRVHAGTAGTASELVAFGLLDASGALGRTRPDNGFWWSVPSSSGAAQILHGSGISIERQGDRIAVTLLGYEAGQPAWYFGSTMIDSSIARVPLMRMSGGSEPFSSAGGMPQPQVGPVINLEFETPARARGWLERASAHAEYGIELQEIALLHVPFADGPPGSAWRGTWVLVDSERRVARLLDLSRVRSSDAETFRISDEDDTLSLDCRLAGTDALSHPAVCTLGERGVHVATLDRVGFERMSGHAADGSAIQLMRVQD